LKGTTNITLVIAMLVICLIAPVAQAESDKALKVLCSTTQVADFLRQIGGDRVEVHCVLAPGADPHTYQPVPGDAKMAREVDICFQNGMHLEGKDWMRTLAEDAGKQIVTCSDGIEPLILDVHGESVNDPHSWFTPKNAAVYINNITKALISKDPQGRDGYIGRSKLYLSQLRVLDSWIREQLNAVSPESRILVTSHDAFNYFCAEYGFENRAPVGWSTGSEVGAGMTPQRRKEVVGGIASMGVKAVFFETTVSPKVIREIALEAGVEIGGELYSDSMGEEGSSGETYIGMMRENVLTIVGALK